MRSPGISRRRIIALSAASAFAPKFIRSAQAQAWPARYVRLIVPFAPGGANEVTARNLAVKLSEIWGQQVVIENRPGASGNVGAEAAMRAAPDGYTIFVGSFRQVINRFLYESLPFDILTDFAPVIMTGVTPTLMCVPNSSPARSVAEFIAHAKASP